MKPSAKRDSQIWNVNGREAEKVLLRSRNQPFPGIVTGVIRCFRVGERSIIERDELLSLVGGAEMYESDGVLFREDCSVA